MNVKRNSLYLLLLLAVVLLASCHKKNQQIDYNAGIAASQQYVSARQMMDLLMNTYFKSITDSVLLTDFTSRIDGATVRYSENPEQVITIDYSSWGVSDGYGHYRSGIITAYAPSGFYDSLATVNIDFENFRYDGDSVFVSGMTVKNLGRTDGENKAFSIKAVSVTRMYSDSTGITFDMDEVFRWQKDASSVFYTPDERFLIDGRINGYLSQNNYYHALIDEEEPVLSDFSCPYAKCGPARITFDIEEYTASIYFPFGDTCNNVFEVDINGFGYDFPFN
jgi:hypothetical protein